MNRPALICAEAIHIAPLFVLVFVLEFNMPSGPIAELRAEHERTSLVLGQAEQIVSAIERGAVAPASVIHAITEFFSLFLHRIHRDKEEDGLVPMLRELGLHGSSSCVVELLSTHADGERQFELMAAADEAYSAGKQDALARWLRAFRSYAEDLKYHLRREEQAVFMMAENSLRERHLAELSELFNKVNARAERAGVVETIAEAQKLIEATANTRVAP